MEFQADWNTDQVNPSTSPKAHCNGLFLTCRDEPNKRLVQHKKRQGSSEKNIPCCKQCPSRRVLSKAVASVWGKTNFDSSYYLLD